MFLQQEKKKKKSYNSDFSWAPQRTEIIGQTATLKFGDTGKYRVSELRSTYLEENFLEAKTVKNT